MGWAGKAPSFDEQAGPSTLHLSQADKGGRGRAAAEAWSLAIFDGSVGYLPCLTACMALSLDSGRHAFGGLQPDHLPPSPHTPANPRHACARHVQVGLLDVDICGPSIPKMLGLEGEEVHQSGAGWSPVYVTENLGVMSIGFMLPDPDGAVVWRGPRKNALIKQFLKDVHWGPLDYLIIDTPPGTSDEHISIVQYLKAARVAGAVVVTTPQEVSIIDVRKEINFCKKVRVLLGGAMRGMGGLVVRSREAGGSSTCSGVPGQRPRRRRARNAVAAC